MSYRYDKQKRKRRNIYISLSIFVLLLVFTPFTRIIFNFFEKGLLNAQLNSLFVKEKISQSSERVFSSKDIQKERDELLRKNKILEIDNLRISFLENTLENNFSHKIEKDYTALPVIKKNTNATILISFEKDFVLENGEKVFFGKSLIGYVSEIYDSSALVSLLTKENELTDAIIFPANTSIQITGKSGSLFADLARDFEVSEGDIVYEQGEFGSPIGKVSFIDFDPRDPSKRIHISPLVNISEVQNIFVKNKKQS